MSQVKIAKRYARALFISCSKDEQETVLHDLIHLKDILQKDLTFQQLLNDASVTYRSKWSALSHIFNKTTPTLKKVMELMCMKRREFILPELIDAYEDIYNQDRGRINVVVKSSIPMDAALQQEIISIIRSAHAYKDIIIHNEIDTELMGGFVIRFGDLLIDTSIKTKLHKIKQEFNIV
jgi:F-type H+-transporting ATPase subunit delta